MIFADMPSPNPEELFSWLKVAAMLGGLWLLTLKIIEHYKAKPPLSDQMNTLRDELVEQFATKDELGSAILAMETKIDDRETVAVEFRKDLKERLEKIDDKLSRRTGEIFDAIRSLGRELSHVEGRMAKSQKLTITTEPR